MSSKVQVATEEIDISYDELIGEMRKRGRSEPRAVKFWRGDYETFENFNDNDMYLSGLCKAVYALNVHSGSMITK